MRDVFSLTWRATPDGAALCWGALASIINSRVAIRHRLKPERFRDEPSQSSL